MRALMLTLAALLPTAAAAGGPLDLGRGTAELGGSATLNLESDPGGVDTWVLLAPRAGYFLADRAELFGGVNVLVGDRGDGIGLSIGARYVGPMGNNHWYAGGAMGWGQDVVADWWVRDEVSLSGLGGFLFPLNQHVAVDVGGRLNLYLWSNRIHIPMGFLGVAGFFP